MYTMITTILGGDICPMTENQAMIAFVFIVIG